MILRRLKAHVENENWFAVAIDFAIVVIGVFIGIQFGNWNDARGTNDRAAEFTDRLLDDLRYEAWAYDYLVEYNKDVRSASKAALDSISGTWPLSDEEFLINAYRATQYKYNDRVRATYDELISTGEIGLIRDPDIRATAAALYTTTLLDVIAVEGREARVRNIFRRRTPADLQAALLRNCGDKFVPKFDYDAMFGSLAYDCDIGEPQPMISATAKTLRENPQFVEALQIRFADVETAIVDLEQVNQDVIASLREITGAAP